MANAAVEILYDIGRVNAALKSNLHDREFEVEKPDIAWVANIAYVWTVQGWLYLAVIIDLFSRRVVGWSMADNMRTALVLTDLRAALGSRVSDVDGLLFHHRGFDPGPNFVIYFPALGLLLGPSLVASNHLLG